MVRRRPTVRELADRGLRDPEEVLVTLWDAGFEYLNSLDDELRKSDVRRATRVLGVPTISELVKRDYWEDLLGLDPDDFANYLSGLGFSISSEATRLPEGALRQLQRSLYEDPVVQVKAAKAEATRQQEERERHEVGRKPKESPPKIPPVDWEAIGWEKEVTTLDVRDVKQIHERIVEDFRFSNDPVDPSGVRDENLLESAVTRPTTSMGSTDKYPTVEMATGALMHSLIHNHPFHNGNKRTALVAAVAMLDQNNLVLTCSESDLFKFVLRVGQHGLVDASWDHVPDREVLEIASWIRRNSRRLAKDERPLKWRDLKKILRVRFDCSFETPTTGNRLNITRRVRRPRTFRPDKIEPLTTQVGYVDEGSEVARSTLHKIRRDLELDEEHHVDSDIFYAEASEIDDFIAKYRKILSELAKF